MNRNHSLIFLFSALLSGIVAQAQNYDYSYDLDTYTELTGATVLSDIWDNGADTIDLQGEHFLSFGTEYEADGSNGAIVFADGGIQFRDSETMANFTFTGAHNKRDNSEISYKVEGAAGSLGRVLKVQYKNVGFQFGEPAEYSNFQIWVYPNTGDMEAHIGPHLVNTNGGSSYSTGLTHWGPGFIISRSDFSYNPLQVVSINPGPENPQVYINEFKALEETPTEGSILKFTNQNPPIDGSGNAGGGNGNGNGNGNGDGNGDGNGNGGDNGGDPVDPIDWPVGIQDGSIEVVKLNVYPNPASELMNVQVNHASDNIKNFVLFNLLGEQVQRVSVNVRNGEGTAVMDVSQLPPGMYILRGEKDSNVTVSLVVD